MLAQANCSWRTAWRLPARSSMVIHCLGCAALSDFSNGNAPLDHSEWAEPPDPQKRPAAVLQWLQQGQQRFLEGHSLRPHSTRQRMNAVVEGQHPLAAVLGCADSRVPIELLFDTGFGDLFIDRVDGSGGACQLLRRIVLS